MYISFADAADGNDRDTDRLADRLQHIVRNLDRIVLRPRREHSTDSEIVGSSLFGEDCLLNCVITDKNVTVNENVTLIGHEHYPVVVEKGSVI